MIASAEVFAEFRPCLILAHADPGYNAQVVRAFRRHGWDVYPVQTGPQVSPARADDAAGVSRSPSRSTGRERLADLRQTDGRIPDN